LRHFNVKTIDDAVSLLNKYREKGRIIAGGVDLVSLMKNKVVTPQVLVNIKTIPDLAYIKEDTEGIKIGTLTTIKQIEASGTIRDKYPMLVEAAHSVAAPQVRKMATIGGNLCQDTRCWYYRMPPVTGVMFFCRKKGGKQCYAAAGQNAYHAIISGNHCWGVSPSDMATALVALDAKVRVAGAAGERLISLEGFYTELGNVLKPYEMITEVLFPAPRPGTKQRFLKFRLRKTIDFAISSVAATIAIESGVVSDARIVLGGIAPIPYRAKGAEEVLRGKAITGSLVETSAKAALKEAKPLKMNAYKVPITETLVRKAIADY
jgi:xanthine dehydrogenase YagS FAD-binding subunit